jgi:2-C-methyl-D-erythritol 4-phosphate cytidylyltransferase / 2-C-methyl-D-erythritol 2,4-cyclodiphosphate synthase
MNVWSLILAAGKGLRCAPELEPQAAQRKQFLVWNGFPLFWHSVLSFSRVPSLRGCVLVFPEDGLEHGLDLAQKSAELMDPGVPWHAVPGGPRRQDSVRQGLSALPPSCTHILIHDGARPFLRAQTIKEVVQALLGGADAVVPAVAVTDTVKLVRQGTVVETVPRECLAAAQTPQGFRLELIRDALRRAEEEGWTVTDDASLIERCGRPVTIVQGDERNMKITTLRDLEMLSPDEAAPLIPCVGWGYDVHRFGPGRPLVLGGVPIAKGPEVVAHSDGDVLLHALADGLLGCLGRGDIGEHFPDTDPSLEGISSAVLVARIMDLARRDGLTLSHVDLTIIVQTPRLSPYREQIRRNVAALLGLETARVNVKATTEEGLGFTGEGRGIKAVAAVTGMLRRPHRSVPAGE